MSACGTRLLTGHAVGCVSQWPLRITKVSCSSPGICQGVKWPFDWQAEGQLVVDESLKLPTQLPTAIISMCVLPGAFWSVARRVT